MRTLIFLTITVLLLAACKTMQHAQGGNTTNPFAPPDVSHIEFLGGNGSSFEDADIVTNAKNSMEGVTAEYAYLEQLYGMKGVDWIFISQSKTEQGDKHYDILNILVKEGNSHQSVYFDITGFWGKW